MARARDEQADLDAEDAELRLARLRDAILEESEAKDRVRSCQSDLRRAKTVHKNAQRKLQELAFLEKRRGRKSE